MARWSTRHPPYGLVCHSDAGSQFTVDPLRRTPRRDRRPPSIGSVGDSYDNALAETVNGLYKTEVIRRRGPWRNVDEVELATLEWVHWFNTARLHGASATSHPPSSKPPTTLPNRPATKAGWNPIARASTNPGRLTWPLWVAKATRPSGAVASTPTMRAAHA